MLWRSFTQQSTTGIIDNSSMGNHYMSIVAADFITWKATSETIESVEVVGVTTPTIEELFRHRSRKVANAVGLLNVDNNR